ncbi:uncharacterized protein MELLADRAFT_84396 [Melampsora larici-populina 98AG31]|uniref:Tet-like 2OG-Fe(II) oxygenase domain-containing protein n=1 Tax=Melampsora larici-populina (strain 98AG31 / pathotype 3-4-7) TaxID=747676 RepID=F4RFL7_MELLP|nr:uncharacterized protein MELLADRAFT_84396 [Melampsora larici-populina 98AG31]EGG08830.1 hypothetical protein MELLADRAFT_84396 [Melampsora larici-populina 98AG31]
MANKRQKHCCKSTEIKHKQDHRDHLLLRSTEKKSNIILHTPKIIETPNESTLSDQSKAQAEYKEKIKEKFGLPPDTDFIHQADHGQNNILKLKYGIVVILNMSRTKMIAVICFNEQQYTEDDGKRIQTEASERLFKQFEKSMSTMYQHGTAQNKIRTNGSTIRVKRNRRGDMFAIGMRPGYLKGVAGVTAHSVLLMDKDLRCQKNLPYIQQFLAGQFSSLALGAFQSNVELCAKYSNFSWASIFFFNSLNGNVFGANFGMTHNKWNNTAHKDPHATGYSFGLFVLIKRLTGKLY